MRQLQRIQVIGLALTDQTTTRMITKNNGGEGAEWLGLVAMWWQKERKKGRKEEGVIGGV